MEASYVNCLRCFSGRLNLGGGWTWYPLRPFPAIKLCCMYAHTHITLVCRCTCVGVCACVCIVCGSAPIPKCGFFFICFLLREMWVRPSSERTLCEGRWAWCRCRHHLKLHKQIMVLTNFYSASTMCQSHFHFPVSISFNASNHPVRREGQFIYIPVL